MSLNRPILATALTGASGAGGTLIYHHAVPWTWKEVLIKDGCYFLNADDEYKAVASEHKKSLSSISTLKSETENIHTKLKEWCSSQLKNNYSKDPTSYANISNLCTNKGITTVKAILTLSGYGGFIVDEVITEVDKREEKINNLYQAVFGIYRYYDKFIEWITKFSKKQPEKPYSKDTMTSPGGAGLRSACEFELHRPYKEISDIDYYTHLSWWCKKLPHKTVEDLIKAKDKDWELDEEATGKAAKWKDTPLIQQNIPKSQETQKIEDSNVKLWCLNTYKKELHDNTAYIQTYRIVKYVCKKEDN